MAKKVIAMTYAFSLKQKFKAVLDGYGIPYTQEYQWFEVTKGFRKIGSVHYIVDEADLAVLRMNLAMENRTDVTYEEREYA